MAKVTLSPNWERVPAGATHYDPRYHNWLMQGGGGVSFVYLDGLGWADHDSQYPGDLSILTRLIKRPPAEPVEAVWRGPEDGLPPAGERVEYRHDHHSHWRTGEVRYASPEYYIIVEHGQVGPAFEQHYYAKSIRVRPIRTPDQIAAEEREKAVKEMWDIYWQAQSAKEGLGLLYDAGCRLPEKSHD